MGRRHRRRGAQRPRLRGVSGEGRAESPRPRTSADRWRGVHHGGGLPWGQVLAARVFRGLVAAGDHPGPRPARFGYEVHAFDPQFFLPFPNGESILLWNDPKRNDRELARFSKKDAVAYPKYMAFWTEVMELIEAMVLESPPPLPDLLGMFKGAEAEELAKRLLLQSASDLLDEFFESDEVKAMLATATTIGLPAGPKTPGTALMLGHMLLHEINGVKQTFGYSKGGMGGISQALAKAAEHHGATIHTGATVQRILTNDGQAIGVELADGKRVMARAILANVDVKTTFERLVAPDALDPESIAQVRRIKATGVVTKVNCVLTELPDFTARPGKTVQPHHQGYLDICPG